jgi:hypothetical protein
MPTLENLQRRATLAITDPHSPDFSKTMLELHNAAIRNEYNKKVIDNTCFTILKEAELEKDTLLQEQLASAAATHEKYLQDIRMQQKEEEHKKALEELEILKQSSSADRSHFVSTQNTKLESEIKELQVELKELEKTKVEIKEEWTVLQDQAVAEIAEELKEVEIVSAKGEVLSLTDEQRVQIAEASRPTDMDTIMKYNPVFSSGDPADRPSRARHAALLQGALAQIKSAKVVDDISAFQPDESTIDKPSISGLREVIKRNSPGMGEIISKKVENNLEQTSILAEKAMENRSKQEKVEASLEAKKEQQKENKKKEAELSLEPEQEPSLHTTPKPRAPGSLPRT